MQAYNLGLAELSDYGGNVDGLGSEPLAHRIVKEPNCQKNPFYHIWLDQDFPHLKVFDDNLHIST